MRTNSLRIGSAVGLLFLFFWTYLALKPPARASAGPALAPASNRGPNQAALVLTATATAAQIAQSTSDATTATQLPPPAGPVRTRRPTRTPGPTNTPLTIPPPADLGSINMMIAVGALAVVIVLIGVFLNRSPRR